MAGASARSPSALGPPPPASGAGAGRRRASQRERLPPHPAPVGVLALQASPLRDASHPVASFCATWDCACSAACAARPAVKSRHRVRIGAGVGVSRAGRSWHRPKAPHRWARSTPSTWRPQSKLGGTVHRPATIAAPGSQAPIALACRGRRIRHGASRTSKRPRRGVSCSPRLRARPRAGFTARLRLQACAANGGDETARTVGGVAQPRHRPDAQTAALRLLFERRSCRSFGTRDTEFLSNGTVWSFAPYQCP
jgi:hypothetical protein